MSQLIPDMYRHFAARKCHTSDDAFRAIHEAIGRCIDGLLAVAEGEKDFVAMLPLASLMRDIEQHTDIKHDEVTL
jgi:hypothetical protein